MKKFRATIRKNKISVPLHIKREEQIEDGENILVSIEKVEE